MNAIHALEFDRIRDRLAGYAATAEGREALTRLEPHADGDRLDRQQVVVGWILRRVEEGAAPPGGDVAPVEPLLAAVDRDGAVLEAEALRDIRAFLEYARDVLRFFRRAGDGDGDGDASADRLPTAVSELVSDIDTPRELLRDLARMILPDGTVNQEAIPELARLRADIRRLNQSLLDSAEQMIRRDRHMYQGDRPTIRDGRTVVPLAANFRGRVDGIVHEASGSGETVYVEPRELVDLNNDLVQAHNGILREIRRVLRELSAAVRREVPLLIRLHHRTVEIDQLLARARYAVEHGGRIVPSGDRIVLSRARHPLLGPGCVPLDIAYSPETRIMVVSGPNTGGKTVLLKTVGLLSMMHQAAIPIPVGDGTVLPRFDYWGVDIGDEQSLDAALSTFSGHLRNLAEVCREAGAGSLILLDELGSGTDPDEGAALSMAIVDHLIERGSTVLATTHQTVLKHYGYTRSAAENASMAFDETTHRPTYTVVPGRPGASHALETARQQGLDPAVLSRAETYHGDRETSVAEIINRLGELERDLAAERSAAAREREALHARDAELQRREREVEEYATRLRKEGLVELDRVLRDARSRIEGEVRRLRERGGEISREDIRAAHDVVREIETQRDEHDRRVSEARNRNTSDTASDGRAPRTGDEVRHVRTARRGTVREIRGDRAEVQFGAIRMRVPIAELEVVEDGSNTTPAPAAPTARPHLTSVMELDLRGRRLADALEELERQLDAAVLNGMTSFSVIHGMGTGVLQKGVRDYLQARPEVAAFDFAAPEEGGFGKTVVRLA